MLCNPFDIEGLSYRIEYALQLPAAYGGRPSPPWPRVRTHDVHRWVAEQLAVISSGGGKLAAEAGLIFFFFFFFFLRSGTGA